MSKRVAFPLCFSLALLVITPATSRGIEEIKIASTGPGVSTLPLEMATRKGFFRDEGLDVLTITMRTNIAVNALLTRSVDYATPSTSAIKAATAGLPGQIDRRIVGAPRLFSDGQERGQIGKRLERQTRRHRHLRGRR